MPVWWGLFQPVMVVPPTTPAAVVETVQCVPAYSYTGWEQTKEEHKFAGEWVVAYRHYQRTKTDDCTGESEKQSKVEGPFRLWPAVPHQRIESVSAPQDGTAVSGTPLRTSDPPYSLNTVQVGPSTEVPESRTVTATNASESQGNNEPTPAPVGVLLFGGILGYLLANRRRLGPGGFVALGSILLALINRTAHADNGQVPPGRFTWVPDVPADDHIEFNARLGPIPERPLEPTSQPELLSVDLPDLPWFSQAVAYVKNALKQNWPPLAVAIGALVFIFGEPWKWVVTVWDRIRGALVPKPMFKPLWADDDRHQVTFKPVAHGYGDFRGHPVYTLEENTREPGLVVPHGYTAEREEFIHELHPDFHPFVPAPEPDPIQIALDRGFTLEAVYYYGLAFWTQAMDVEYEPWEIEGMNERASLGLTMGGTFDDYDRYDEELRAFKAFAISFFAGADAYEADSKPEVWGAVAGDTTAGFVAYGDIRDLIIQGYRDATGQEVDKATVSLALIGLLMELGWADGIVPDPADGANAILASVKAMLKKVPAPVRKVFAGVYDAAKKAEDKRAFFHEVREAIVWAYRNPKTAERMVQSGKGLDDLILAAKNATKVDSEKLARNLLAQNPNLVQKSGYAAHHIVAGNDPRAEDARRILEKLGIDINTAENGVFLPQSRQVMNGEAYHRSLHTDTYYQEVWERLRVAATKDRAIEILQDIADELSKGIFPR